METLELINNAYRDLKEIADRLGTEEGRTTSSRLCS